MPEKEKLALFPDSAAIAELLDKKILPSASLPKIAGTLNSFKVRMSTDVQKLETETKI